MSLKREREKAAEDLCYGTNLYINDALEALRAAEKRAMERLWQWVDETYGDVSPSEPLLNALLDEEDEA